MISDTINKILEDGISISLTELIVWGLGILFVILLICLFIWLYVKPVIARVPAR